MAANRRQLPPNYRVHYDDGKIIIGGRNVENPVEIRLSSFKRYAYTNSGNPISQTNNSSYDVWRNFQKRVRIFDMIKDGKAESPAIPQDTICKIMETECVPFSVFDRIKSKIQEDAAQKITKTTWLNPNEKIQKLRKLSTRNVYKESGLGPDQLVEEPTFCSNIATEIIDPFTRAYEGFTPMYFPPKNTTLEVTSAFFDLFGFNDCSLFDRRIDDNIKNAHVYKLQIAPDIFIPSNTSQSDWYAGNPTKNKYFNDHKNDPNDISIKKALLNVKELGDVLQVLLMFASVHIEFNGKNHTMVTGDEIVFMLCIQLGLDCIFYHHIPHGEHEIYHFKGNYSIADARSDFNRVKNEIHEYNRMIIVGVTEINANENLAIEIRGHAFQGFRFKKPFLDDMLNDMQTINDTLLREEYDTYERGNSEDDRIRSLGDAANRLKKLYTLKMPFTISKRGGRTIKAISFSTGMHIYTEGLPEVEYRMEGYTRRAADTFWTIYKAHYENNAGSKPAEPSSKRQRKVTGGLSSSRLSYKQVEDKLDIFELSFPALQYTVKDKDCRDEKWIPESYCKNFTHDATTFDIHHLWKEYVQAELKKRQTIPRMKEIIHDYLYDIWQELYHESYVHGKVYFGKALSESINQIIRNLMHVDQGSKKSLSKVAISYKKSLSKSRKSMRRSLSKTRKLSSVQKASQKKSLSRKKSFNTSHRYSIKSKPGSSKRIAPAAGGAY